MRTRERITFVLLSALLAVGPFGVGCSSMAGDRAPQRPNPSDALIDPPRRPGQPVLLVAMPSSAPFQATRKGLLGEVARSYDVVTFVVGSATTPDELGRALEAAAPACIVVMNNSALRLYRDYQRARKGKTFPPAVVVMTSFLEDIKGELVNATGISYEVPGVTAFVGLRAIVKTPVSRVGVIHAHYSQGFIERQRALAAKEHVSIFPVEVSSQPTLTEIRNAFRFLKDVNRIDALWVLNDNRLLKDAGFLVEVWQPEIEALRVPVIVGAAPLVSAQASFGTFAVLPDHAGLGVQAANLILDLAEEGWNAAAHPIELPLSTTSVLDVVRAREHFGLHEDALKQVDLLIE